MLRSCGFPATLPPGVVFDLQREGLEPESGETRPKLLARLTILKSVLRPSDEDAEAHHADGSGSLLEHSLGIRPMTRPTSTQGLGLDRYPVLYVDDEPENLRVFELSFQNEFSIMTATCAEDGLRILAEHPVAVVVSDHRMSGMQGTVFLSHVRELAPSTVRILMTAFGDADTLHSAINEGAIYRYIPKPWEPDEVAQTLRGAIDLHHQSSERAEMLLRLRGVSDLAASFAKLGGAQVEIASATLDLVVGALDFDGATWLQADPSSGCLQIASMAPFDHSLSGHRIDRDGAPEFIEKLRRGESQLLSQSRVDTYEPSVREWLAQLAANNVIMVPICPDRRFAAALAVDNRRGSPPASEADRALLEGIAGVAALALRSEGQRGLSHDPAGDSDWLATLGALASCVSKELAKPVGALRSALPAMDPSLSAGCEDICTALESIAVLGEGPDSDVARHPCDLGQEVRLVCAQLAERARSQGVDLDLDLDESAPKLRMLVEPFRQLVRLLVQSSLQQLSAGGRVRLSVAPASSGSRIGVAVTLHDNGNGVGVEELEDIDYANPASTAGEGLAGNYLSASQYLVSALGGELEVSSEIGAGKRVRVWFAAPGSETSGSSETDRVS